MNWRERNALVDGMLKLVEERLGFELCVESQAFLSMKLDEALSDPQCDVFTLRKPRRPRPW